MKAKDLVFVALFAALISIGAQIRIPIGPVPITMQVPFVLLAGAIAGPKIGVLSSVIYLLLGFVGIPVFAGGGGLSTFASPTLGFLISYPLASFVAGLQHSNTQLVIRMLYSVLGMIVIYIIGFIGFYLNMNYITGTETSMMKSLQLAVLPFLLKDIIVAVVVGFLASIIQKRIDL